MEHCKPANTPGMKLLKATAHGWCCTVQICSSLLYLSGWIRPDIVFVVSHVVRFYSCPTKEHWTALKRILRYTKGMSNYGLTYLRNDDIDGVFIRYSDANWAGYVNNCKSTSGYLFMMSGAAVSMCCSLNSGSRIRCIGLCHTRSYLEETIVGRSSQRSTELTVICKDNQLAICIASITARPNTLVLSIIMFKRKFWTPLLSYDIVQPVTW